MPFVIKFDHTVTPSPILMAGQVIEELPFINRAGYLVRPPMPDGWTVENCFVENGVVRLKTQAEMDAFNAAKAAADAAAAAALEIAQHDGAVALYDASDPTARLLKAVCLVVLDEVNTLRAQHGLAARTAAQFKTAVLNKIA